MPPIAKTTIVRAFLEKIIGKDGEITYRPVRILDADVDEDVDSIEAAKISGLRIRTIQRMCENGELKTAYKPRNRRSGPWKMSRNEILALRSSSAV